jgi:hypothetical protein
MKLLFLYGPPAVGKLTVGREIAALTGWPLFHNHATLDLARQVYPSFGGQLFGLAAQLRLAAFSYVASQGTSLVFTNVYTGDEEDTAFVRSAVRAVQASGGEVVFARLHALAAVLLNRVSAQSRLDYGKVTDQEKLKGWLERNGASAAVPYDSLAVDTSLHEPAESARLIVEYACSDGE